MKKNKVKMISIGLTILGFAATIASNWVDEQNLKQEVEDQVNATLLTQKKREEEES